MEKVLGADGHSVVVVVVINKGEQIKHHDLLGLLNTEVLMSFDNTVKQNLSLLQAGCLMMISAKGGSHVTEFGFFVLIIIFFFPLH